MTTPFGVAPGKAQRYRLRAFSGAQGLQRERVRVRTIQRYTEPMSDRVEQACADLRVFIDEQSQFWSPKVLPAELFHYTSPDGLIGIISNRSLWASDMLSLNDQSEVTYPQQLIADTAEASPSIPRQYRDRFKKQLTEYLFRMDAPYTICFCEEPDLLSQWRGYGVGGEGFAVGFSVPWLSSLGDFGFRLQRVIYDVDQQKDLVLMFLNRVENLVSEKLFTEEEEMKVWQLAAASLSTWVVMFKHPSFSEEREWRVTSEVERRKKSLTTFFRRSGHRFVPYVIVDNVDDAAITRLVRGPYFRGTETRGVGFMLVARGFITAAGRICDSIIPLVR